LLQLTFYQVYTISEKHPNIELIFNLQELFQIICLTNKWKQAFFLCKKKKPKEKKSRKKREKQRK
jgi:hypothetical protein